MYARCYVECAECIYNRGFQPWPEWRLPCGEKECLWDEDDEEEEEDV